jgi:DNA-binding transcriptional MerR regulator/uncharacterized protein (DUF433 family)
VPVSNIVAFTTPQVVKLTGLSASTLRYWERTEVFIASYVDEQVGRAFRRIYSIRDVVSLRTLALLRRQYHVSLDQLRRAGAYLTEQYEMPWASLRFGLAGKRLVFRDPESGQWRDPPGQTVLEIPTLGIPDEISLATRDWSRRAPEDIGRIERNRYVQHNAWIVAGTRIPTATIWAFHEAGYSTAAIMREFPRLTHVDIERAIGHEEELRRSSNDALQIA